MNKFTYENQGTNTYLVYTMGDDEIIDTMSLGMITNNAIPGLAQTTCIQMNNNKFIKYNVTAKVSVSQFFSGVVNKTRLLRVFSGIVKALLSSEDYMIDHNMIMLNLDYIFADVSTCETSLICLPVVTTETPNVDLGLFFKNIMFSTQFDQTENCDYVAKIMNHLNSMPVFSLALFKNVIDELLGFSSVNSQNKAYQNQGNNMVGTQMPFQQAFLQQPVAQAPVVQQSVPQKPVVQQPVQTPVQPQVPPVMQNVKPIQNQGFAVPNAQSEMMQGNSQNAGSNEPAMSKMYLLQHYNKENKAIYDAQQAAKKNGGMNTGVEQPNNQVNQVNQPVSNEPPMSKMYLLQHYNKENRAIYDAQQAAKKNGKQNNAVNNTPVPNGQTYQKAGFAIPNQVPQGMPNDSRVQHGNFAVPEGTNQPVNPIQQPIKPIQQPVRPIQAQEQPVQMPVQAPVQTPAQAPIQQNGFSSTKTNFGETVVLNSVESGGTTVLNESMLNQKIENPHLIRKKNNENIPINKPVFRIGKEKSYVDYFISDNSTISRSHANIITRNGKYFVIDTNSTNHTFLDGSILQSNSEYEIVHGSKLRFANEDFDFLLY